MADPNGTLNDCLVLIVDDDPDIRASVEAAFQASGANTISCSDGRSASRLANEKKPDLVILDMMLPGQSGYLVLEQIKGFEDSPIVIMITANEGRRHRTFAEGLGADMYLQKPLSLEHLLDISSKLLEKAADDGDDAAEEDD